MADYFTLAIGLFSQPTFSIWLRFMIEVEERISYTVFTGDLSAKFLLLLLSVYGDFYAAFTLGEIFLDASL